MFKGYGSEEFQESLLRMEKVLTPKRFKTSSTMKKLTNKEKIAILKKMRALLVSGEESCFCFAYEKVTGYARMDTLTNGVMALGLQRPQNTWDEYMWYGDSEIRIKKIDQLIKRLSK